MKYHVSLYTDLTDKADEIVAKLGEMSGHKDLLDVTAESVGGAVEFTMTARAGGIVGAVAVSVNYGSMRLKDAGYHKLTFAEAEATKVGK